jgi:hypothetical protein
MSEDMLPGPLVGRGGELTLPPLISAAGPDVVRRVVEFFTARIRNRNTRRAYARAVGQFCAWCEAHGIRFAQLQPVIVAAYIEAHPAAPPTVKQHLAAVRMLCDYLVVTGVLPMNPATAVRGPKHSAKRGKTPVLSGAEARAFLEAIDTTAVIGLRDRALVRRHTSHVNMRAMSLFRQGGTWQISRGFSCCLRRSAKPWSVFNVRRAYLQVSRAELARCC